MSPKRVC